MTGANLIWGPGQQKKVTAHHLSLSPFTYTKVTGVVLRPSPVLDKDDGHRPHTGGLSTKIGDGYMVMIVTFN